MSSDLFGVETIKIINALDKNNVKKMTIIMRHSAKRYDETNPAIEPFMGLTGEGKEMARQFGKRLPSGKTLRLFSSSAGRCIETAYLIDKEYTACGGKTVDNKLSGMLAPFYVKNSPSLADASNPDGDFLRQWFDGNFPADAIENAGTAARKLAGFLTEQMLASKENDLGIHITHDWSIYLIKECILGLKHEEYGMVDFMEGIVIYAENDAPYITSHQCVPRPL